MSSFTAHKRTMNLKNCCSFRSLALHTAKRATRHERPARGAATSEGKALVPGGAVAKYCPRSYYYLILASVLCPKIEVSEFLICKNRAITLEENVRRHDEPS